MDKLLNGKYEILQRLKSGGFSTVYLAKDINLDMKVVLKKFHKEEMAGKLRGKDRADKYSVEQEIKKAIHFNHPNIARYFDFFTLTEENSFDEQNYEVGVMEYISGGTIKEYIDQHGIDSVNAKNAILGVLKGLKYLHDRNIIHRDIKSDNILMSDNVAKIIDFGISKRIQDAQTQIYGEGEQQSELITTFEYCAPEQIDPYSFGVNETISYGVDVWMFGVLTYYLCTGKFPFGSAWEKTPTEKLRKNILSQKTNQLDWKGVSEFYQSVISICLTKKAGDRPSVTDILGIFESQASSGPEQVTKLYEEENKAKKPKTGKAATNKILYYLGIPLLIAVLFVFGYSYFDGNDDVLNDGLKLYEENEKYGYKNSEEEIVIPAKYTEASSFENGQATVQVNDSIYKINEEGNITEVLYPEAKQNGDYVNSNVNVNEELSTFIDQFNQELDPTSRVELLRSYEKNFESWSGKSSIFALNDLNEASLKAVFLKATERNERLKMEGLEVDQDENKIQYALFSFAE